MSRKDPTPEELDDARQECLALQAQAINQKAVAQAEFRDNVTQYPDPLTRIVLAKAPQADVYNKLQDRADEVCEAVARGELPPPERRGGVLGFFRDVVTFPLTVAGEVRDFAFSTWGLGEDQTAEERAVGLLRLLLAVALAAGMVWIAYKGLSGLFGFGERVTTRGIEAGSSALKSVVP